MGIPGSSADAVAKPGLSKTQITIKLASCRQAGTGPAEGGPGGSTVAGAEPGLMDTISKSMCPLAGVQGQSQHRERHRERPRAAALLQRLAGTARLTFSTRQLSCI